MAHNIRPWARILAIGCVLLALGGCAAGQSAADGGTGDATDAAAQEAANGQTFEGGSLSWEGKELDVELEADPTTGYNWEVMITGNGLDFTGRGQKDAADDAEGESGTDTGTDTGTEAGAEGSVAVGTPVIQTFTFTGTSAGAQTITMTYKRESGATDEDKILTIEVVTGDDGTIESAEAVMTSGAEAAAAGADANSSGTTVTSDGTDTALADAGSGTDADVSTNTDSAPKDAAADTTVAETNG